MVDAERFVLTSDAMRLSARRVPWDSEIFGFPVVAIDDIEVHNSERSATLFAMFEDWVRTNSVDLISCRLPHDKVYTSMFLERRNFRFVEMVLHPTLRDLQSIPVAKTGLQVLPVTAAELPEIVSMAEHAFGFERYHVDPRIDSHLADLRYGRWVRNSLGYPAQLLLKVVRANDIVGFFLIENTANGMVHWHLTAVNPAFTGQGLGAEIWRTMIAYHTDAGMSGVITTIAARNTPVLNLYSKLNFRFSPPEMTLHWLKSDSTMA